MSDWIAVLTNDAFDTYIYRIKALDSLKALKKAEDFADSMKDENITEIYVLPYNEIDVIE